MKTRQQGFSLIEVVLVVGFVAVLGFVAVAAVGNGNKVASDTPTMSTSVSPAPQITGKADLLEAEHSLDTTGIDDNTVEAGDLDRDTADF